MMQSSGVCWEELSISVSEEGGAQVGRLWLDVLHVTAIWSNQKAGSLAATVRHTVHSTVCSNIRVTKHMNTDYPVQQTHTR